MNWHTYGTTHTLFQHCAVVHCAAVDICDNLAWPSARRQGNTTVWQITLLAATRHSTATLNIVQVEVRPLRRNRRWPVTIATESKGQQANYMYSLLSGIAKTFCLSNMACFSLNSAHSRMDIGAYEFYLWLGITSLWQPTLVTQCTAFTCWIHMHTLLFHACCYCSYSFNCATAPSVKSFGSNTWHSNKIENHEGLKYYEKKKGYHYLAFV